MSGPNGGFKERVVHLEGDSLMVALGQRRNSQFTVNGARIKARAQNKTAWCIGVLFACCLLVAVASPWTVTGSNQVPDRKQDQSAQFPLKASLSESQNSVSLLGNYLGNQDSTERLLAAGIDTLVVQRPQSSDGVWQTIDKSSIAAVDWQAPPAD